MTYDVLMGTLNPNHSVTHSLTHSLIASLKHALCLFEKLHITDQTVIMINP